MGNLPSIDNQDVQNLAFGQRLKTSPAGEASQNAGELRLGANASSIFNILAGENGVLDQDEVAAITTAIGNKADDNELSRKEIKEIIAELANNTQFDFKGLKNVSWKDFHEFIYQLVVQSRGLTSSQSQITRTNADGEEETINGYCIRRQPAKDSDGKPTGSYLDEYYDADGNLVAKEIASQDPNGYRAQYNGNQIVWMQDHDEEGHVWRGDIIRTDEGLRYRANDKPPIGLNRSYAPAQNAINNDQLLAKTPNGVSLADITVPEDVQNLGILELPTEGSITPSQHKGETIEADNKDKITYNDEGFITQIESNGVIYEFSANAQTISPKTGNLKTIYFTMKENRLIAYQAYALGGFVDYNEAGDITGIYCYKDVNNVETKVFRDAQGKVTYYMEYPIVNGRTDYLNGIKYDPYGREIQE